jgi:hypothetical protein
VGLDVDLTCLSRSRAAEVMAEEVAKVATAGPAVAATVATVLKIGLAAAVATVSKIGLAAATGVVGIEPVATTGVAGMV